MYLLKIFVNPESGKKHEKINDKAKIDYRNISSISTVIADEIIGEAVSPDILPVEEQTNLYKIKDLKDLHSFVGDGVYIRKNEPSRLYAEKSGEIVFKNGKFYVNDKLNLKNIDFKTGNIVFPGDVSIEGDIKAGFSVNARNIEVKGSVDNARLIAGETVVVSGGVIGLQNSDFCSINAGKLVYLNFIENSKIECSGAVYIKKSSMHTDIYAKERIVIFGEPGLAVGGELISRKNILLRNAGSKWGTKTILKVGIDPFKYLRLKSSENKRNHLWELDTEIEKSINYVKSVLADNSIDSTEKDREELEKELHEIESKKKELTKRIARLKRIIEKLKLDIEEENNKLNLKDTAVFIFNKIYPGADFRIGFEHHKISDEKDGAKVTLENDKIVFKKIL
jgi:uncharacterized protein (DUF342 family)